MKISDATHDVVATDPSCERAIAEFEGVGRTRVSAAHTWHEQLIAVGSALSPPALNLALFAVLATIVLCAGVARPMAACAAGPYTLSYSAGPGGAVEGSSAQVVNSSATGTELEGFENVGQWTEYGAGSQSADTANVLHGSASLRLTASPGVDAYSYKNVSVNLSSAAPFRLWFYIPEDPMVATPLIQVKFVTANWAGSLTAEINPAQMVQGWNCVALGASDFIAGGNASWSSTFTTLQLAVYPSDAPCSVSFDTLAEQVVAKPTIAVTFDDGWQTAYEHGYTYMGSKGLAGTMYVVPTVIGEENRFTLAECAEMDGAGWDIANHTWDHPDLTTLTQPQVQSELSKARDWLVSNGFTRAASDVAYPDGAVNSTVLAAMAAEGMRSGRTTKNSDNTLPPLNPYRMNCWFPTTLAECKAHVDQAVNRGSLVVLGFHDLVSTTPANTGQFPVSDFQALIDYIIAKHVAVVRMSDVMSAAYGTASGTMVTAVPAPGYTFVSWSDNGSTNPVRQDMNVTANISTKAIFAPTTVTPVTCTLTYIAGSGGTLSGVTPQTIAYQGSGTTVTAVPNAGYQFTSWSDGLKTATRTDNAVTADMNLTANFVPQPVATTTSLSAPSAVIVKRALKLTGSVSPAAASGQITITMTRLVGLNWVSAGSSTVDLVGGAFAYSFKPKSRGAWRFTATYSGGTAGSTTYLSSTSAAKSVLVL